ncbi:hypothetical protein MNEG_15591, partial [Monoraphidium neglectum]
GLPLGGAAQRGLFCGAGVHGAVHAPRAAGVEPDGQGHPAAGAGAAGSDAARLWGAYDFPRADAPGQVRAGLWACSWWEVYGKACGRVPGPLPARHDGQHGGLAPE